MWIFPMGWWTFESRSRANYPEICNHNWRCSSSHHGEEHTLWSTPKQDLRLGIKIEEVWNNIRRDDYRNVFCCDWPAWGCGCYEVTNVGFPYHLYKIQLFFTMILTRISQSVCLCSLPNTPLHFHLLSWFIRTSKNNLNSNYRTRKTGKIYTNLQLDPLG